MPLLHSDVKLAIAGSLDQFFKDHEHYKDSSQTLKDQTIRSVGPEGLLYVNQREIAGTTPEDGVIKYLGTEDATTCHILVLRHSGSGAVVLSHFDGTNTEEGVKVVMTLIKELSQGIEGRMELHLAGGFCDDRHMSVKLSLDILNAFSTFEENVHLLTACITDLNNVKKNGVDFPVIYGLAVDVKTGDIFQANFPEKGPDMDIRSARNFTGGHELVNIYDHKTNLMTIGPFSYEPLSYLDFWMKQPDDFLLQNLSTSPEQEPPGFIQHIKETLAVMKKHPRPKQTVFPGNKGHEYKKEQNGSWTLLK
ncbi:protein N-terminal asparagine amidohydrolase-like [Lineus longissimus]|uniref:protein N-terminal asparagine amidohydrolase-like n=1 Tax=Lineus longissimus TaxID=88925 RepID=UPI002B4EFD13